MPHFWGRRSDSTVEYGEVKRAEIPALMDRCVMAGWQRVTVAEHMSIMAAYFGNEVWLHPQLRGDN